MNKVVFGIILGGVLGIFDGLSALLSAPEVRPQIAGIVVGSTIKGVLTGGLIGFFSRKVNSLPLGILFGAAVGFGLAYLVVLAGNPYFLEIMLPGGALGLIVGYATQKFGRPARSRGAVPSPSREG